MSENRSQLTIHNPQSEPRGGPRGPGSGFGGPGGGLMVIEVVASHYCY